MLEMITKPAIRVINSTYTFLVDNFGWMDNPGTYILWIVIGLIYVPFFVKGIYYQYAHPP